MISRRVMLTTLTIAAMMVSSALAEVTRQADQTATAFYLSYRDAFRKATKIDDILPYLAKSRRGMIDTTPAGERPKMFEVIKSLDRFTNVKVLKETKTATGATLSVEGLDSDKTKSTATIDLVREDGAWKIDKESWTSK